MSELKWKPWPAPSRWHAYRVEIGWGLADLPGGPGVGDPEPLGARIYYDTSSAYLEWRLDRLLVEGSELSIRHLETEFDAAAQRKLVAHLIGARQLVDTAIKTGRRPLSDEEVAADLREAIDACRRKGWEFPSWRQLADHHTRRFASPDDEVGFSDEALRGPQGRAPGGVRQPCPLADEGQGSRLTPG